MVVDFENKLKYILKPQINVEHDYCKMVPMIHKKDSSNASQDKINCKLSTK